MKIILLSNSNSNGGIAFNIMKISKDLSRLNRNVESYFFTEPHSVKNFFFNFKYQGVLNIYTTSIYTFVMAYTLYLMRLFLFRETRMSFISYHEATCDPKASLKGKANSFLMSLLPSNNLFYYTYETAAHSGLISKDFNIHYSNPYIIGLDSYISYVDQQPIDFEILKKLDTYSKKVLTIGRLVDFKMGSILSLIEFAKDHPDVLTIIVGDGEYFNIINRECKKIPNLLHIPSATLGLCKSLFMQCDIYVGMGTTLIDASSLGCVTVHAQISNDKGLTAGFFIPEHKFTNPSALNDFKLEDLNKFLSEVVRDESLCRSNNFSFDVELPAYKIDKVCDKSAPIAPLKLLSMGIILLTLYPLLLLSYNAKRLVTRLLC